MGYRSALFTVLVGSCLGIFSLTYRAEAEEKQSMQASAKDKHSERPVYGQHESKTFSPSVVDFLGRPLTSQLVTINPSGTPQVTVMWFKHEDGALLFTTTTDRIKFRNYQKDPRAVFSVVDPANMYKWVIVQGKMSVDTRDPAAFYQGLAEHYLDAEGLEDWRKRAGMDKRTVLRLTPTTIRTMGFPEE